MISDQSLPKQKLDNIITTLQGLGYSEDESKEKTLEDILDLIHFKEAKYKKSIFSGNSKNKEENQRRDNSNLNRKTSDSTIQEKQSKNERKNSEQLPVDQNKSEKNIDMGEQDNSRPTKYLDEKTNSAVVQIVKNLTKLSLHPFYVKEVNWRISELSEHIKEIRYKNNPNAKDIIIAFESSDYYPQLFDFRNKLFDMIQQILNYKVKKTAQINQKELENLLSMCFTIRVFSFRQMDQIINIYSKFCAKAGLTQNQEMVDNLISIYERAKRDSTNVFKEWEDSSEIPQLSKKKSSQNQSESSQSNKNNGDHAFENESCIICMEKTREMVFLPCSHFLTCPLCAPRIDKCPICNNPILKKMKIFWC